MATRRRSPLHRTAVAAVDPDAETSADLPVTELRRRLHLRGLETSGRKAELVTRPQDTEAAENRLVTMGSVRIMIAEAVSSAVLAIVDTSVPLQASTASSSSPLDPPPIATEVEVVPPPPVVAASASTKATTIVCLRGEFVDLKELLPKCVAPSAGDPHVMHVAIGFGQLLELKPAVPTRGFQVKKCHVHDMGTCMTSGHGLKAFSTYTRVQVDACPELAADLLAYQAIIVDANTKYYNDAWLAYDHKFRLALASLPHAYSWGIIDPNLWQSCLTSKGRPLVRGVPWYTL